MSPIEWLEHQAQGFNNLPPEERDAIMHFALLWSLFEAKILNSTASAKLILAKAREWQGAEKLKMELFSGFLEYFQARYYKDGSFTDKFQYLCFRPNDQRPLVEAVIKGDDQNEVHKVAALFIITYRFRNNLFHGTKWAYELRDQLENFNHANQMLMAAMEL